MALKLIPMVSKCFNLVAIKNFYNEKLEKIMSIRAEYIWIDGTVPLPYMRSKTKIVDNSSDLPIWGFDGSSTNQAPGDNSDCVLNPVFSCPDPIRGGDDILVLCEVLLPDGETVSYTHLTLPTKA